MCGITGYWVRRGEAARWLDDLGASVDALRRRGPDDSGVWVRPGARVALGHTRLSILDLSRLGHQPMRTPDGALTMVFNGEVYNFAQIRAELESLGHAFRSKYFDLALKHITSHDKVWVTTGGEICDWYKKSYLGK